MLSSSINISVIIPCRNEERYIEQTIERISAQTGAGKIFNYEVLFIDGCSNDMTADLIKKKCSNLPFIRILKNPWKITPSAFNIGIKNAKGRYICILGAHAEIADDYLINCLNTIRSVDADNVGGPWIAKGYTYTAKAISLAFRNPVATGGAFSHRANYEGKADSVWGGFYKREVFDKIGLFDEELVRDQDEELNYRLLQSGGTIWQSPSIKYHYIFKNGLKALFRQYFYYGYWKVKILQKYKSLPAIRHLVPGTFVISVLLLSSLSFISYIFLNLFLFLITIYAALVIFASFIICAKKENIVFLPVMPAVLTVFHVSYGLGFIYGIWDFILKSLFERNIKHMSLMKRL